MYFQSEAVFSKICFFRYIEAEAAFMRTGIIGKRFRILTPGTPSVSDEGVDQYFFIIQIHHIESAAPG